VATWPARWRGARNLTRTPKPRASCRCCSNSLADLCLKLSCSSFDNVFHWAAPAQSDIPLFSAMKIANGLKARTTLPSLTKVINLEDRFRFWAVLLPPISASKVRALLLPAFI